VNGKKDPAPRGISLRSGSRLVQSGDFLIAQGTGKYREPADESGKTGNRGQSRVLSFFSFPRPCQAAAESEKSRADSRFGRQTWLSSRPHARRTGLPLSAGEEVLLRFDSRGFALFAVSSGMAGDCRCYNEWMLRVVRSYTNLSRKCDFRRFYCRAGVSTAIERLTLAGETPALHSEVQKQAAIGITQAHPSRCRRP
jgi:hypothetical protein